jgi:hypothetical protein
LRALINGGKAESWVLIDLTGNYLRASDVG